MSKCKQEWCKSANLNIYIYIYIYIHIACDHSLLVSRVIVRCMLRTKLVKCVSRLKELKQQTFF